MSLLYECDPKKNIACAKTDCHINGGHCRHTRQIQFAKLPIEKVFTVLPVEEDADEPEEV
jgi:hypothetical protein